MLAQHSKNVTYRALPCPLKAIIRNRLMNYKLGSNFILIFLCFNTVNAILSFKCGRSIIGNEMKGLSYILFVNHFTFFPHKCNVKELYKISLFLVLYLAISFQEFHNKFHRLEMVVQKVAFLLMEGGNPRIRFWWTHNLLRPSSLTCRWRVSLWHFTLLFSCHDSSSYKHKHSHTVLDSI